jgi:predicted nucleic acid-binding protein
VIVVDSNVIAYCWILGERTEAAQRVRLGDPEWHVPYLWRSELRSTLAGYLWRGAIEANRAAETMAAAEASLAGCEHHVSSRRVLELAAASRLSAYDCEFVALAESLAAPLVTEDAAVRKAFPELAISMEGFLARFPAAPPAAHEKRRRYRKLVPGPSPRLRRPG